MAQDKFSFTLDYLRTNPLLSITQTVNIIRTSGLSNGDRASLYYIFLESHMECDCLEKMFLSEQLDELVQSVETASFAAH